MESSIELTNSIFNGTSPEEIQDKIKEILYTKSAEKIEKVTPFVAADMFNMSNNSEE
jgi:hypothetical protein